MSTARQRHNKRITIKDVALDAGVSITTVSNVLNGRTEAMTADTLHRIQETIQTLGYRPSSIARSLVTNHTTTIGLIVDEINTLLFLQALNDIETITRNADHNILFCVAHNLEDEEQAVNLLLEKQADGIIFFCNSHYIETDYLIDLPPSAPPLVLINRTTTHARFDQINWDNVNGMISAIAYLVQLGHTQIAHLSGPETRRSSAERLRGYKQGLERFQLTYCQDYVQPGDYLDPSETQWEQSTQYLLNLPTPPTAIIAINDIVAAIAMRTVQQAGLKIPQDITIIGYDNQPFCTYLNPTLTSIKIPTIESGKLAAEMLLGRLTGQRTEIEHHTLPCSLIVRESSGIAP